MGLPAESALYREIPLGIRSGSVADLSGYVPASAGLLWLAVLPATRVLVPRRAELGLSSDHAAGRYRERRA